MVDDINSEQYKTNKLNGKDCINKKMNLQN